MVIFMLKKVILSTVIASSAITSANALDFNDKFYGKANVKIGYNYNNYKVKDTDLKNQSHGVNAGAGFDVFFKATNNIHPFAGLEVNGNYMFKGFVKNQSGYEFNQFFNTNVRFGASFKVNKDLSINPYGLVGFNVSRYKVGDGATNTNNIDNKKAAIGYVIYNWFKVERREDRLPQLITFNNFNEELSEFINLLKDKIPVYSNKDTYTGWDRNMDAFGTNSVEENVKDFANFNLLSSSSKEGFIEQVKNKVGAEYLEDLLWTDGKGTYVYYDISNAEVIDSIVEEWANNAGKYPDTFGGQSFLQKGREYILNNQTRDQIKIGLNVGAGVDFVIKERFTVGVEYKFSQVKMYGLSIPSHAVSLRLGVQFL
jgi:opacity protein-like surface antigen